MNKHNIPETSENVKEIERLSILNSDNSQLFSNTEIIFIDLLVKEVKQLRKEVRYLEKLALGKPELEG
jgi:hypothetical protein